MKKLYMFLMALIVSVSIGSVTTVTANAAGVPTEAEAYEAMIALKDDYPEGMRWTNDNYYGWKGGVYSGGYGCAGFAFLLSDAAFGDLPARTLKNITLADVHVGDILRVNNDTHSVIVLEKYDTYVILAEGNYNSSIHWGRRYSAADIAKSTYMMTRYPVGTFGEAAVITFDFNNGTGTTDIQVADFGQSVAISRSVVPSYRGYRFSGWATTPDAVTPQYQPGDSITLEESITLYAVWESTTVVLEADSFPKEFQITIGAGNDGTCCMFTPAADGLYTFESTGSLDTYIKIYEGNALLGYDDDSGDYFNFKITQDLKAGVTYSLVLTTYNKIEGNTTLVVSSAIEKTEQKNDIRELGVSLTGSFDITFYLELGGGTTTTVKTVVIDGPLGEKRIPVTSEGFNSELQYPVDYSVYAKNMADEISITLLDENGDRLNIASRDEFVCSLNECMDGYMNRPGEQFAPVRALAGAIKDYGKLAQSYFEYNTQDLGSLPVIPDADFSKYASSETGSLPEGLEYLGSSLLLEDLVTVRHYFKGSFDGVVCRIGGKTVTPHIDSATGVGYLEVKGIGPLEMVVPADVSVEKNADKWVLSYCAFSYANRVEDSKLKQLVNAMYRYYEAAYAYEY